MSKHKIDIAKINSLADENPYKLVEMAEKQYEAQLMEIANEISVRGQKIVLISGPSSAGKTTSSFRLAVELKKLGIETHTLNMDNFFLDMDLLPLREDGKPDIEGICALDVETVRKCFKEILQKGKTKTPQFDFATHKRKAEWVDCELKGHEVIIMEGIHALNPQIVEGLELDKIYKIYLCCEDNFVCGRKTILYPRQLRLLRRMARDERDRGCSIEQTIEMWEEVCRGEDKNITPFKNSADYLLNTIHCYEPLLYKQILLDKFQDRGHIGQVAVFLEKFKYCSTIDPKILPQNSLIREFVGGLKLD
ncbi:MAG: uridine kinase [Christensenellales bacterium]